MLNGGDAGLPRSLDKLTATQASAIDTDELVFFGGNGVWRVEARAGAPPHQIPIGIAREAAFSPNGKLITRIDNIESWLRQSVR